jgi:hypothetical protein
MAATNTSESRQKAITLSQKVELLREVDKQERTKSEICKEFEIANSTLSTILKNRNKIIEAYERSEFEPSRKRMRSAKNVDVEEATLMWFKQARTLQYPITGPLLMAKASQLAVELGSNFEANTGWLERFKVRQIHLLIYC